MITMDASDRNKCIVNRQVTNTPLQALILMNDPQYVEATQLLANRMINEGGRSIISKIRYGFRLATSRYPNDLELERLMTVHRKQNDFYSVDNKEAEKLIGTTQIGYNPITNYSDVATFFMIASTIINLDETVRKG